VTHSPHDQPRISRREALTRLTSTAAGAAAIGAGAYYFHDRRSTVIAAPAIPDWRLPQTGNSARTVVARGTDPAKNVRRAIAALGGMEKFVRKGESVLIKPNVGWDRLPEQAANTDPQVVAELVRLCKAAGAGKVIVADISVNESGRCFARSGIQAAAAAAGAEVRFGGQLTMVPANLGGYSAGLDIFDLLLSVNRIINVPVAKHHGLSRVTLGMKNWMGVLGRGRNRLHQEISRSVAELGATFRPTLTVMDATRVLMRNGPQGGSLDAVKQVNAVAAGIDPVLCDAWGAAQLGVDTRSLGYLVDAEQRGLGRSDLKLIQDLGAA